MTFSHPRDVNPCTFFLNKQHNNNSQSHGNRGRKNEPLAGSAGKPDAERGTHGDSQAVRGLGVTSASPRQLREEALGCCGLSLQSSGAWETLRL